jgi:hypothetical protein
MHAVVCGAHGTVYLSSPAVALEHLMHLPDARILHLVGNAFPKVFGYAFIQQLLGTTVPADVHVLVSLRY